MAHWVDLSAHNLALWRLGNDYADPEMGQVRTYVLLPVFEGVRHTDIDPASGIGQTFSWNQNLGAYVYKMRLGHEKLPAFEEWLESFPGALIRGREPGQVTYSVHQKTLLQIQTLPVPNPWVWSNKDRPERFFANEEQALADESDGSVLRDDVEVDPRGVMPLRMPVHADALADLKAEGTRTDEGQVMALTASAEAPDPVVMPALANFLRERMLIRHGEHPDYARMGDPVANAESFVREYSMTTPAVAREWFVALRDNPAPYAAIMDVSLERIAAIASDMEKAVLRMDHPQIGDLVRFEPGPQAGPLASPFSGRVIAALDTSGGDVRYHLRAEFGIDKNVETVVYGANGSFRAVPLALAAGFDRNLPGETSDTAADVEQPLPHEQEGKRADYGVHIPGARKDARLEWEIDIQAQIDVYNQARSLESAPLKDIAGQVRRDAILGPITEKLERCADSPIKQALWSTIYEIIPASVKSAYWGGKRKYGIDGPTQLMRIIGYLEIVESIGLKIENLPTHPTGKDLFLLLNGDPMLLLPEERSLMPSEAYGSVHPALSRIISGGDRQAYQDIIRSQGYGLGDLMATMVKGSGHTQNALLLIRIMQKVRAHDLDDALREQMSTYYEEQVNKAEPAYKDYVTTTALTEFDKFERGESVRKWRPDHYFLTAADLTEKSLDEMTGDERRAVADRYTEYLANLRWENMEKRLKTLFDSPWTISSGENIASHLTVYRVTPSTINDSDIVQRRVMEAGVAAVLMDTIVRGVEGSWKMLQEAAKDAPAPIQETPEEPTTTSVTADAAPSDLPEVNFITWRPSAAPMPPETGDEERYRNGPKTVRGDRDVTERELCETFGFRAVQYGNWMTQKDRQEHLNAAFDSCFDIKNLFDLENPRMVALPRMSTGENAREPLAIALGARGRGKAKAHYEPTLHVINMTKTRGAGAFLHEWVHAADAFYGAEITKGTVVSASNLPKGNFPKNPFQGYVEVLKGGLPKKTDEDRLKKMLSYANDNHRNLSATVWKTFFSRNTQEFMFSSLTSRIKYELATEKAHAEGTSVESGFPYELLKSVTDDATREAAGVMNRLLPKMAKGLQQTLDGIKNEIAEDPDNKGRMKPVYDAIKREFFDPFYRFTSSRSVQIKDDVVNQYRAWCGQSTLSEEERHALAKNVHASYCAITPGSINHEEYLTWKWAEAVLPSLWKNLCGRIVNDHGNFGKSNHQDANQSQFFADAQDLGEYWARDHELIARAIAAIGYDKLLDLNTENTYLTDSTPLRFSDPGQYRADSEPQGVERDHFSAVFYKEALPALKDKLLVAAIESFPDMVGLPEEGSAQDADVRRLAANCP